MFKKQKKEMENKRFPFKFSKKFYFLSLDNAERGFFLITHKISILQLYFFLLDNSKVQSIYRRDYIRNQ